MSALGQERTSPVHLAMSALPQTADKERTPRNVRFVPIASECTAANSTLFDHLVGGRVQKAARRAVRAASRGVDAAGRRSCLTIRDACDYMTSMDKKREPRSHWQRACKLILTKR